MLKEGEIITCKVNILLNQKCYFKSGNKYKILKVYNRVLQDVNYNFIRVQADYMNDVMDFSVKPEAITAMRKFFSNGGTETIENPHINLYACYREYFITSTDVRKEKITKLNSL